MHLLSSIKHNIAKLTRLWIKPTVFPKSGENIRLHEGARVYYVLANHSATDRIAAELAIKHLRLPSPNSSKWWHYLSKNQGRLFARRRVYTPSAAKSFIAKAHRGEQVQLVPISVFWGREPNRDHDFWRSLFSYNSYEIAGGFRRFMATIVQRNHLEVHIGNALYLNEFLRQQSTPKIERKIHRLLRMHFGQVRRAVVGPDLSHRRTLVNDIVRSKAVQSVIKADIEAGKGSRETLEAKAAKYGNEIAANYNNRAIRIMDIVLSWFWNKIYDGVQIQGLDKLRELGKDHEIVYLPCHRSHIDYLLISYVLYKEGIMPPHIAAGINLNMPVVGRLLRGCGAFFIRRSFKGNKLYTEVFNEYLHTLLSRGFPVEFYIEGGRSRTGRSLPPKTGMLALMLKSYLRDHRKPIALVPVYVGYEKVLEGRTYLGELRGQSKKSESVLDIFKVFGALRQNFGKVDAAFGEPIYLNEFLDDRVEDWRSGDTSPEWLKPVTNELGDKVVTAINDHAHVNAINLVATALLAAPRQTLGCATLIGQINLLQSLLRELPYSKGISFDDIDADRAIEHCEYLDVVDIRRDSMGSIVHLNEVNSVLMSYYRNNVQHVFALPSLFAYALKTKRGLSREALLNLVEVVYPYLRGELFLNLESPEAIRQAASETLDWLLDKQLLIKQGNAIRAAKNGSLGQVQLRLLSALCAPIIERFYIVISLIANTNGTSLTTAEVESKSVEFAERLSMINGIHSPEYFDKRLFKGFITALIENKVIRCDASKVVYDQRLRDIQALAEKVISNEIVHNLLLANVEQTSSPEA